MSQDDLKKALASSGVSQSVLDWLIAHKTDLQHVVDLVAQYGPTVLAILTKLAVCWRLVARHLEAEPPSFAIYSSSWNEVLRREYGRQHGPPKPVRSTP
jgi:hypothetical protein